MVSQSETHAANATHTPLNEVHMLPPLLDATGVRCSCINVILSRNSNMRITTANLDVISKTFRGKKMPTTKSSQIKQKFKKSHIHHLEGRSRTWFWKRHMCRWHKRESAIIMNNRLRKYNAVCCTWFAIDEINEEVSELGKLWASAVDISSTQRNQVLIASAQSAGASGM